MIRHCPNCDTERPLTEIFCEGVCSDHTCGWDLSSVDIVPSGTAASRSERRDGPSAVAPACRNGHQATPGDLLCAICGEQLLEKADPAAGLSDAPSQHVADEAETVVDGWRLLERIVSSSAVRERYSAVNVSDGRRAVLTLYSTGSEPDPAVYDLLAQLPRDHVSEIFVTGRWHDRAFEVAEEFVQGTLTDLRLDPADPVSIEALVAELARAVHAMTEAGLRHRDLRPAAVFVRTHAPLDLAVGGFGSARLSEFDLDIVSPLETSRYMAPEAIAGGVASASDWWSLGMMLLEKITLGACFEGVNDQAFLIHVLTNGVHVPDDLEARTGTLLRGLLARDRRERWQWKEVEAWLRGETPHAPAPASAGDAEGSSSISLGSKQFRSAHTFALAAAEAVNWDQARTLVLRGAVAGWAADAGFDAVMGAGLRKILRTEELSDDLKLSLSLRALNPAMPLIVRGNIVTPGWLLDHPEDGYALISGPAPDFLRELDPSDWLWRLKLRSDTVRKRIEQLAIAVDEDALRVNLLSTSAARLAALWNEKRRLLPDTDHSGIATLTERRMSAEEDLVILLSATAAQFRSADEVVAEAAKEAQGAGIRTFSAEEAHALLALPRREIYRAIDERIEHFARCGVREPDEWADQFRLDRRMSLGRAVALLAMPADIWRPLPKQGYVSTILDFFAKRISGAILRGPLTRMVVGKSARIDLTELGTPRVSAADLLDQLLARTNRVLHVDPAAFAEDDGRERRLRSLHSHALLYRRDTGIDGLYMGFPFVVMRDGRPNARPRIAPVLLWPVRVSPEVGNRGHVTIAYGRERSDDAEVEHVVVNPALEGIVGVQEAKRWQEAASELLTNAGLSVQAVMDAFSRLAQPVGDELIPLPGKETEVGAQERRLAPSAVLFHLAFMGQAVMKDLELIRGVPPAATALEAALRLKEPQETPAGPPVREINRFFTAESDPSQEAAVIEAREGSGLVIEGPPGTGKSQTIVNMVADAIGSGRSLLVICQKQAALDVVRKRLDKEGLTNRFVMITDVNRDRAAIVGAIRSQVQSLHEASGGSPVSRSGRERLAARIETLEADLDRRQDALHTIDAHTGMSYRSVLGELLDIEEAEVRPIDAPELRQSLTGLRPAEVAAIEEECGPLAKYWLPAKVEGNALSALKPVGADRAISAILADGLRTFLKADARREKIDAETSDCLQTSDLAGLEAWLTEAEDLRLVSDQVWSNLVRLRPLFRGFPGEETEADGLAEELLRLGQTFASLDGRPYDAHFVSKLIDRDVEELRMIATLARRVRADPGMMQKFNPMWWIRARRLRDILSTLGLPAGRESAALLDDAAELELVLRNPRAALGRHFEKLFGRVPALDVSAAKLAEFAGSLHAFLSGLRGHNALIDRSPARVDLDRILSSGSFAEFTGFFDRGDRALSRNVGREASRAALSDLSNHFDELWLGSRRSAIDKGRSNEGAVESILQALPALVDYMEYRARASRLSAKGHAVFAELRRRENELSAMPPEELDRCIRATLRREALLDLKSTMERRDPDLRFDADEFVGKVNSLADADAQIRNLNRDLLVRGIDAGRIRPASDWEPLTRLTGARALRLREFIDRAMPLGLFAMRPVWLMTPDVASRVLQPRAGLFDTVIFDEASQMPVEYALPSLFRSRLVVVSGDEKQMPPTAFFASKVENDEAAVFDGEEPEDDATDEERDLFAENWNRREIKDCPDLLQLARTVLRTRTLQVHYRSKFRELISFSNASFYGNGLSVPVRHPEETIRKLKPIEVIRADGVYKGQTNEKEAVEVVEYLARLWQSGSPPSVGVVTFNRKQADAIDDALEARAEEDEEFRASMLRERERSEQGEDMGFFVKNVENVQGDERDIIVFSTTFGRNERGIFRRNFGALGQSGGERRLNVAVTRAREKVVIVTSMPTSDISDLLTRRSGPRTPRDYLQGYLEYARTVSDGNHIAGSALLERMVGGRSSQRTADGGDEDGFIRSVEAFLTSNGWQLAKARDGGAFGLDFAVIDPRSGLYAVGVECDAPRHRLLRNARAREIWRANVLKRAFPHVHRVSSYAWVHHGEAERLRLKGAVENVLRSGGIG